MKPIISRATVVHIHRSVALFSILIIIFTAISGLLLQHAEDFNWHKKNINQNWMFNLYDVKTSTPIAYAPANNKNNFFIQLAHQWYFNHQALPKQTGNIKGAVYIKPFWIVASERHIFLYSDTLEIIETIDLTYLNNDITHIGIANNLLQIKTQHQQYQADADFLTFSKIPPLPTTQWSSTTNLPQNIATKLPKKVSDISYLRLMQDLHGGRLFSLPHWLIPDLTAFSLLFLSLSGLLMKWQRRPRKK